MKEFKRGHFLKELYYPGRDVVKLRYDMDPRDMGEDRVHAVYRLVMAEVMLDAAS